MQKKWIEKRNISLVQKAYRTEYKNQKAPDRKTILGCVGRFEKTGSINYIAPIPKDLSQKRKKAIELIKSVISEKPELSIRRLSIQAEISYSLTRDILLTELKLKPYKYQSCQQLDEDDFAKRVDFARWFLDLSGQPHLFTICTDESYFYLTQAINKQNQRMWLKERPNDWIEQPLHDEKILVWCGFSANKVFGPYFFENSVNQYNYLDMLKNFFWKKYLDTANHSKYYFQQDGASAHTANTVQNWLKSKFSDRFIDKKQWPPRSPDLNPCDYFLWGYLKQRVYYPKPTTIEELKQNIIREIKSIPKNT